MGNASISDLAVAVFHSNENNCAQAVLVPFGIKAGLSETQCLKIAAAFGGGIAKTGATCGAVTGAVMALGLAGTGEGNSKKHSYDRSFKFMQMFEEKFGSTQCSVLTGAKQDGDTKHYCDKFVQGAALMVEDLLKNKEVKW